MANSLLPITNANDIKGFKIVFWRRIMKNYKLIIVSVFLAFISFTMAQTGQLQTVPLNQTNQPSQQVQIASNPAISQSPLETQWFGVSTGFPLSINMHYGLDNIITQDLDLRFNGSLLAGSFSPLQMILGIGVDLLYNFDNPDDPQLGVYAGGGLGGVVYIGATTTLPFNIDIHGVVGAEYRFTEYGVFGEVNVGNAYANNFGLGAALRLGFNYHFQ